MRIPNYNIKIDGKKLSALLEPVGKATNKTNYEISLIAGGKASSIKNAIYRNLISATLAEGLKNSYGIKLEDYAVGLESLTPIEEMSIERPIEQQSRAVEIDYDKLGEVIENALFCVLEVVFKKLEEQKRSDLEL